MKREGAFEDTMFLIDLLKQSREKEIKQKKVCEFFCLFHDEDMQVLSRKI